MTEILKRQRLTPAKILKYVIIYLILLIFLYISLMPIVFTWFAAFKPSTELLTNRDPLSFPKEFQLENFKEAWTVGRMGTYMKNSLTVTIPTVLGVLFLASMAGFSFGKLKFPGSNKLFFFFLIGLMMPIQVLLIPLYYTVQGFGLINSPLGYIVPTLGTTMPFAIFMMRAFYKDLPNELMDSSRVDGCNNFQMFWHIFVPLTKPALTALLVFEFMWAWNDLQLPLLIFYDDTVRTLPLGLMYFKGKYSSNQTLIAAAVSISSFPIVLIYVLFQRTFIQGITAGAVKG